MFTKEDLDSWNELFPNCIMRESDLANPSEPFLVKTLISYLGMFGYRVEQQATVNAGDGIRERRVFLIKLVRHIERILKITDKTYTFTYYDLLRPTPKKTSHMLGILLNYLYYYNMYRTDVFTMAHERLKSRQELLDEIKRTGEENEQRQLKSVKIKDEVALLSSQIPQTRSELEMLCARKVQLNEQLQKLQQAVKDLSLKVDELAVEKRNLKRQIVPESEGKELHLQMLKLRENITEREQTKCNLEGNVASHISELSKLQELLNTMKYAKDIIPPNLLEYYKNVMSKLSDTKAQTEILNSRKENLLETIKCLERSLKETNKKLSLEQKHYEGEKQKKLHLAVNKEKESNALEQEVSNLEKEEHAVECLLEEQKEIRDYIQTNLSALLKPCEKK